MGKEELKKIWINFKISEYANRDLPSLMQSKDKFIKFLKSLNSLENENDLEKFKESLSEFLHEIAKTRAGINFQQLGFGKENKGEYSINNWKKLFIMLKKFIESENMDDKNDAIKKFAEEPLSGYGSTGTLTPIFHLIDPNYTIINSAVKDFLSNVF